MDEVRHEELQRRCDALATAWEEGFAAGVAQGRPPNPYRVTGHGRSHEEET